MVQKIFISYSHEDTEWLNILKRYLSPILDDSGFGFWDDSLIEVGADWFNEIDRSLQTASIGILLVSHNFTSSKFIREHELPKLLERAENKNCQIFAILISPVYESLVETIKQYQWANSPKKPLQKLKESSKFRFEEELIRIGQKLQRTIQTLPQESSASPARSNIHILTGVKGGVGKTLLSLATLCTYMESDRRDKKLLCVDINTTNNDLYRLLAGKSEGDVLSRSPWNISRIAQTEHYVAKRRVPYALLDGVMGFWFELANIVNHDMFRDFDVIVDTNLHIANLMEGGKQLKDAIGNIRSGADKNLFLWIVWTFASLADDEYVQSGVAQFNGLFPSDTTQNNTIIHVLNPSALTAPQTSIQDEVRALVHIQQKKETYDRLIAESEQEGRTAERDALKVLRDEYLSDKLGNFRIEDIDLEVSRPFPGLYELMTQEDVTEDIAYDDFIEKIGQTITNYPHEYLADVFENIYESKFHRHGRPRNLLPISTHDPKLRGYTEHLSGIQIEALCEHITYVQRDVSRFLKALTLVND